MPRPVRTVILPARDFRGNLVKPGDTVTDSKGRRFIVSAVDDRHVATMIGGFKAPTAELTLQAIGTGGGDAATQALAAAGKEDVAYWLDSARALAGHGAIMGGSVRRLCANIKHNPFATDADRAAAAAILATLG